jgi:hypothetical protein
MAPETVTIIPLVALTLGAIALGGGIYETLLVDLVWPGNPAIIQPSRGGLDRKRFWGPLHPLFEIPAFREDGRPFGRASALGPTMDPPQSVSSLRRAGIDRVARCCGLPLGTRVNRSRRGSATVSECSHQGPVRWTATLRQASRRSGATSRAAPLLHLGVRAPPAR